MSIKQCVIFRKASVVMSCCYQDTYAFAINGVCFRPAVSRCQIIPGLQQHQLQQIPVINNKRIAGQAFLRACHLGSKI